VNILSKYGYDDDNRDDVDENIIIK